MKPKSLAGEVAFNLGKGIIAGLAGTVAITISQAIEMKLTNRKPSTTPADAVTKVLDIKAVNKAEKPKFVNEIHWTYGTTWGLARTLFALMGLRKFPAGIAHFAAIWGTAMVMLPALEVAPPVKEWGAKSLTTDGIHHLVYAAVAGIVFDAID